MEGEPKIESGEPDYEELREEIASLQKIEADKKKRGEEKYDPDLEALDPAKLENVDLDLYKKFKAGVLTIEESNARQNELVDALTEGETSMFHPHISFFSWINNQIGAQEAKKIMEEFRKTQEEKDKK